MQGGKDGRPARGFRLHRLEIQRGGKEQHKEHRIEDSLQQPHRHHGAHGNIFLFGNVSRPNEFSWPADKIDGTETQDLADKQDPERGFLDRAEEESPPQGSDKVGAENSDQRQQQRTRAGSGDQSPQARPPEVAPLGASTQVIKNECDDDGSDTQPQPSSVLFSHIGRILAGFLVRKAIRTLRQCQATTQSPGE